MKTQLKKADALWALQLAADIGESGLDDGLILSLAVKQPHEFLQKVAEYEKDHGNLGAGKWAINPATTGQTNIRHALEGALKVAEKLQVAGIISEALTNLPDTEDSEDMNIHSQQEWSLMIKIAAICTQANGRSIVDHLVEQNWSKVLEAVEDWSQFFGPVNNGEWFQRKLYEFRKELAKQGSNEQLAEIRKELARRTQVGEKCRIFAVDIRDFLEGEDALGVLETTE